MASDGKRYLLGALTDKVTDREMFMKGIVKFIFLAREK